MKKLYIIAGLTGAGKELAARIFLDAGITCARGLRAALFELFFTQMMSEKEDSVQAVTLDLLDAAEIAHVLALCTRARQASCDVRILFFEASDETLLCRLKERRGVHPLEKEVGAVYACFAEERRRLMSVRAAADWIFCGDLCTANQMKAMLGAKIPALQTALHLRVFVESFGYMFGAPRDADLTFDVRCLPNPYYVPEMKRKNGLDAAVSAYVLSSKESRAFLNALQNLLAVSIPMYSQEGKAELVIAVGCTGGKHRSVAVAERLCRYIGEQGYTVQISHRDIYRAARR